MKLQALLIAVAMVAGGSAFAAPASDSASTGAKTAKPTAGAPHKAKTTKAKHKTAHHAKTTQQVLLTPRRPSHHMEGSTHHMGRVDRHAARPICIARDRQSRIDDAYSKWKANNG